MGTHPGGEGVPAKNDTERLHVAAGDDDDNEDIRAVVRNNARGRHNHSFFWTIMAPAGKGDGGEPSGALADAIKRRSATSRSSKSRSRSPGRRDSGAAAGGWP